MANRYPYVSSSGPLTQALTQFRKSFPPTVDAQLFKKLGIAPNNESYIVNIFRFLDLIDQEGNKNADNAKAFLHHKTDDFQTDLSSIIEKSYSEIFDIHGSNAWEIDQGALISFFRTSDQSSDIVGKRQATTFSTLATLAGKRQAASPAQPVRQVENGKVRKKATRPTKASTQDEIKVAEKEVILDKSNKTDIALTVRIEINLPAQGDQEIYDRIFRSIRNNFINEK